MKHLYRIGVFDDVNSARHAVDDAVAAGVSKKDILMVFSEDQPPDNWEMTHTDLVVHPAIDTERGHYGGAAGGAVGGFLGSLAMYLVGADSPWMFVAFLAGTGIGIGVGAMVAKWSPSLVSMFVDREHRGDLHYGRAYDEKRSTAAGAIGGFVGSIAGLLASYLIGIPSLWYFITTGLWAAMASFIVGALVGAMSGRGLAPSAVGMWEDLVDGGHKVLVSIDCSAISGRCTQIEDMLRKDGAIRVKAV